MTDEYSGSSVNELTSKLFAQTQGKISNIIVLSAMYQNNYPEKDINCEKYGTTLPLKTHQSSYLSSDRQAWLTSKIGGPAHFMVPATGIAGACLMHAEMNGLEAVCVTAITDSHSMSTEALQAFGPVLQLDLSALNKTPKFRSILAEANQRQNTIFS